MVVGAIVISVSIVSLLSLIGIFFLSVRKRTLQALLLELVAFSIGALLGGAFLHLLPESFALFAGAGWLVLLGFFIGFLLERAVHWHHCHEHDCEHAVKPFAWVNLVGDGVHNLIDGAIIASAFLVDTHAGVATTIAVALHELPQEIGDYAVLVHAGLSRTKALALNFASAATAFLGAFAVILLNELASSFVKYLLPIAAGLFIYLAATDLIPELHKEKRAGRIIVQLLAVILGLGVMALL
ncbi:ZIP family metal transporter [Candidatus Woesearchaeota archaeon]|nr:MAG: ZIP family metal transporter [Candidatus Woesearchaeota archaeon]